MILLFNVCDIAKRFIEQVDDVAFFSARNESEREVTEKQISEYQDHKAKSSLDQIFSISDVMQNSNQNLQTSLKNSKRLM